MSRPSSAAPEARQQTVSAAETRNQAKSLSVSAAGSSTGDELALCFGAFRLQPDGTLLRGETEIHLPPRELAALRFLLAHAGRIVPPLQLKKALWGEVHVTADSVPKCVSSLRSRLAPDDCIQTVYKRGYRFGTAVRAVAVDPAGGPLPRMAILPFKTGFGVPEYLGPAIAEETIARLTNARPARVSVLARDSVFTLAERGFTGQQLGEALRANLILTGSLRASTAHYRLRMEMIRASDGTQMWVEDVLVAQSRIAGLESEVLARLNRRLGAPQTMETAELEQPEAPGPHGLQAIPAEGVAGDAPAGLEFPGEASGISIAAAAAAQSIPREREAYEIFRRARFEWQSLERHRMQDGLQHLTRATELDPSLISAKTDLAHLCVTQAFYGFMAPSVSADLIRRTADSIPGFADSAPALLPAYGWVCFHADHNLPAALWAFSRSAHLLHDPWTTRVRAMFALGRHRFSEAIDILRAALDEDPFSPWLHNRLAWALHLNLQADQSMRQIEKGISLFPEHEGTNLYGSMILAFNGQAERAVRLARDLALRLPYFDLATVVHAYALARAGSGGEARAIMERLQWLSRERFVLKSFNAAVYLALGDPETALGELRAAADDRCPWFFQMLADPRLEALQQHAEFRAMRAQLAEMEAAASPQQERTGASASFSQAVKFP